MILAKPAPFVSAFIDAVDEAIRPSHPHHGMSAIQRTWLAFCVTAVLVTNSICWARFERASLGTYSLAALSWMFRHSKIPWDHLLVASVRVILRHHGLTSGSLVIDDTDHSRSKSAKALAHLYNSMIKFFPLAIFAALIFKALHIRDVTLQSPSDCRAQEEFHCFCLCSRLSKSVKTKKLEDRV